MFETDLILLHPPSVYDFRKKSIMYGPISDMVPSTPIFEMYPIGFVTIAQYLRRYGYSVRIINVALKMLKNGRFDVEKLIRRLNPLVFGIDLHWLVHAQGSLELAKMVKKYHPETPVIFGGLSASYYHEELIRYPQVDYVIRGDSAEEPLRRLLQVIKKKELPEYVPNLTWQSNGRVQVNELSYLPTNLDDISFDYRTIMKSSVRYNDLEGYLPFHNKYCDMLLEKYSKGNGTAKVRPHISPLAPFLDPGSQAFEDPQRYGYKLFYKTLEEHRQALLAPSWKYTLNYETEWMSRDELVNCIYEAALQLNQLKAKYGLVKRKEAKRIEARIKEALDLTRKIDDIMSIKDREMQRRSLRELGQQFNSLNSSTICEKEELWWTAGRIKFNFPRIIQTVLAETWDITRPWIFRKGR